MNGTTRLILGIAGLTFACLIATGALADDLAAVGQGLYVKRCEGCHTIDDNSVGPRHRGIVGRKAGAEPGYAYSAALKNSGIIWTEANIDQWLQGPSKMVPGVRMAFSDADANERQAIIAYLKTQK